MQGIKTGEYILYWKTLQVEFFKPTIGAFVRRAPQCLSTLLVPEAWDEYKQKKQSGTGRKIILWFLEILEDSVALPSCVAKAWETACQSERETTPPLLIWTQRPSHIISARPGVTRWRRRWQGWPRGLCSRIPEQWFPLCCFLNQSWNRPGAFFLLCQHKNHLCGRE